MDSLVSGVAKLVTLDENGLASLTFSPPRAGKYVFLPVGAPTLIGVYEGNEPVGARGKLRVEPGSKRGVRTLNAVPHLVTFKGSPGASVTLTARPWSFWDYFG